MRLSVWNDHIKQIKEDGAFKFMDLRVKSYKGKFLTTTVNTKIIKIQQSNMAPRDFAVTQDEEFTLPADTIMIFELCHYCPKCTRQGITESIFLRCTNCGAKSLLEKSVARFSVKLGYGSLVLTLPHAMLLEMADLAKVDVKDTTAIQAMLLSNEDIKGTYSNKMITAIRL